MTKNRWLVWLVGCGCLLGPAAARGQYVVENLGRGVVALRTSDSTVYVGWRLLGSDPANLAFNVYRSAAAGPPVKLNTTPITATTDFVDTTADPSQTNAYSVRAVLKGVEFPASTPFVVPAGAPIQQYVTVPLQRPAGGSVVVPTGNPTSSYSYNANDASVADLDGDGEYEIVLKWDPSNSRDTASAGLSGNQLLDAYKLDGTRLWRIDLGRNIRAGAHYTQFMVYDFDGDGKAEVACKTADGTADGQGTVIGDGTKDYRSLIVPTDGVQVPNTSNGNYGKVLAGPEYLTIFDGLTGAAMATTTYMPGRDPANGWGGVGGNGNFDNGGNRNDRFLAAVAYFDGHQPSLVMARGYYGRSVLAAWDWRGGTLTSRWVFDSGISTARWPWSDASPYSGQGNHNLSVADVDGDGKDEIVYGSMVVDDNGQGLFSTGLRHGDAMHAGDLVPSRPGLEVFGVHESEGQTIALNTPGMALYDARTGEIIWSLLPGVDVGRGMAADIDPRYPGYEFWGASSAGLLDGQGQRIGSAPGSTNSAVWWDDDLLREVEDSNWISKWDPASGTLVRLLTADGASSNNGSKANACVTGDILGDWREEVVWRASDNLSLRIYSTTIPARNRLYTLMHDPQYRLGIAWQNVAYNQPPHPSFFLGEGMAEAPVPHIVHKDTSPPVVKASKTTLWPPNHEMVPVSLEGIDLLDPSPSVRIISVTSTEPVNGEDDGNTEPDWEITGPSSVNLRAERSGVGTGRVYTITAEARDASGNTAIGTVEVTVPLFRK